MRKGKTQNMQDSKNPLNKSARGESGENKTSGPAQKDWTREDRGSTEYEKHR